MHSTSSLPNPSSAPASSSLAASQYSSYSSYFHPHALHHHLSRRDSASSSSDEDNALSYPQAARTSPDLSSLTPSSSVPSSPKRAPGLSPSPSFSIRPSSLSAPASPSLGETGEFSLPSPAVSSSPAVNTGADDADAEEEEDEAPITALPGRLPRPKTKLDRERERAAGLGLNSGVKKEGLGKKLARKRADSLKWAKYANVGTFEIELGLSNDELMRK